MKTIPAYLFLLLVFCWAGPAASQSVEFGIIMDTQGEVIIETHNTKTAAKLATALFYEDRILLKPDSSLTIVAYETCHEWVLKGPGLFFLTKIGTSDNIISDQKPVKFSRKMPTCFALADFQAAESGQEEMAYTLKGLLDPVANFRKAFELRNISNSSLLTLIMHDVKQKKIKQAKPYFDTLKKRLPDQEFVMQLEKRFYPDEKSRE